MNESIEIYDINKNDEVDQFVDLLKKDNDDLYVFNNELVRKNWNLEYAIEHNCPKYIIGILANDDRIELNKRYSFKEITNHFASYSLIESCLKKELKTVSVLSKEFIEHEQKVVNECADWIIKHFCEKEQFLFVGNKIFNRNTGDYFVTSLVEQKIYFINIYTGQILCNISFEPNKKFNGVGIYYHTFIKKINAFDDYMKYDIIES